MSFPITATFIDEITYDIPSSNWSFDEWKQDLDNMKKVIRTNKGTAESNQTVSLGNLLLRGWISPLGTPHKYLYLLMAVLHPLHLDTKWKSLVRMVSMPISKNRFASATSSDQKTLQRMPCSWAFWIIASLK